MTSTTSVSMVGANQHPWPMAGGNMTLPAREWRGPRTTRSRLSRRPPMREGRDRRWREGRPISAKIRPRRAKDGRKACRSTPPRRSMATKTKIATGRNGRAAAANWGSIRPTMMLIAKPWVAYRPIRARGSDQKRTYRQDGSGTCMRRDANASVGFGARTGATISALACAVSSHIPNGVVGTSLREVRMRTECDRTRRRHHRRQHRPASAAPWA